MNSLNMSGAATKISGMFGALEVVLFDYGYKPDVVSGISSGSVLSMIAAMMPYHPEVREKAYRKVTSFTMKDFMSKPPYNHKGNITLGAKWRVVRGKPSLGEQDNLEKTLGNIITPQLFAEYKNNPDKYPEVIIGTVDYTDGKRKYFDVRKDNLTYEEYLRYTNASASIPIAVEPIDYKGRPLFDGGVRDHIGTGYVLTRSEYKDDIKSTVNIFSRPKDYKLANTNWCIEGKNALDVAMRTFDIMNVEISKNDEYQIEDISDRRGLDSKIIYLENHMKSLYDTDKGRLLLSYFEGVKDTKRQLNID